MPRNRLIKLEFWRDEKIGNLSHSARLLFVSLWTFADDSGNGRADPRLLRSQAFPYDAHVTVEEVEGWFQEIATLGMAVLYEAGGARFYTIKNFRRHQVINRPSKFRYQEPSGLEADTHEQLTEHSVSGTGVLTDESKRKCKRERKRSTKASAHALIPEEDFENLKITDARYQPVVDAYFGEFKSHFGETKPDFDASDAKALKTVLKRREESAETLKAWLVSAFDSDDVPPLRPRFRLREFCAHAVKFESGPIKKGGPRPRAKNLDDVEPGKFDSVLQ
jgi:hypothetical protein